MTISVSSNPPRDCPLWELGNVFEVSLNLTKQLFSLQARNSLLDEASYQHTPVDITKLLHSLPQLSGYPNAYNARRIESL
jgi:hypothetical protein